MTCSHVWHDSFACMTDMTHLHVWHDSFACMIDMTHLDVWHDSFTCVRWLVSWLVHMCDMTRSQVWRDSFTSVTSRIHSYEGWDPFKWHPRVFSGGNIFFWSEYRCFSRVCSQYVAWLWFMCVAWLVERCVAWLHYWFIRVTWLNWMCDMNHALSLFKREQLFLSRVCSQHVTRLRDVWHRRVTRLIQMCDITGSDAWRDAFRVVTRLVRMCDMTHPMSLRWVTWLIQMCDMTRWEVWQDAFGFVTRLVRMCDTTHPMSLLRREQLFLSRVCGRSSTGISALPAGGGNESRHTFKCVIIHTY